MKKLLFAVSCIAMILFVTGCDDKVSTAKDGTKFSTGSDGTRIIDHSGRNTEGKQGPIVIHRTSGK